MEIASFVPKLPNKADALGTVLLRLSQFFFVLGVGLTPLFFIPNIPNALIFSKVYFLLACSLLAILFFSLHLLRTGSLTLRIAPVILGWWGIVLAGLLSALLSPNLKIALFGDVLEIHTVGFLALLGVVMSLSLILTASKRLVILLYGSMMLSFILIVALFAVRVFFGTGTFTLGILGPLTDTPLGSFNDFAILAGLVILLTLVSLAQLDLPKKGLYAAGLLLIGGLFVLASANFFYVWLVVSLFSLLILMFLLTRDRFGVAEADRPQHKPHLIPAVSLVGLVCVVSVLFLIGGTTMGAWWSNMTGVQYIEIRPSFTATFDVMQNVYHESALVGIGPNRFSEAWNLYKDAAINTTVFWNTPFSAGAGYIPTWFVTSGILGVVAWFVFLGLFLFSGLRTLLNAKLSDSFWFFITTISFVAGAFIWTTALVYVPGPLVLIIGASTTGLMIVSGQKLVSKPKRVINLLSNTKTGFVLIASVMICIIATMITGYGAAHQVAAAYQFSTASRGLSADDPNLIARLSEKIAQAYLLYPSDLYARTVAQYQLSEIVNTLLQAEPTKEQEQSFQSAIATALNASTQAIGKNQNNPQNWQVLGDVYANLTLLKIEGAKERAFESYARAEALDPQNPYYVLQKAAIESRVGNVDEARRLVALSLQMKPNFADALDFSIQLDVNAGDIDRALATSESIVSLEQSNPGRFYQLGVLYAAVDNTESSIAAFSRAIALNPSYANARYFLAQQYLKNGDTSKAISELKFVRDLSPDNSSVNQLIADIESGAISTATLQNPVTLDDGTQVNTQNEVTTTNQVPESDLLTPVNTGGSTNDVTKEENNRETSTSE